MTSSNPSSSNSPITKVVFIQKILFFASNRHIHPITYSTVHPTWTETLREDKYRTSLTVFSKLHRLERGANIKNDATTVGTVNPTVFSVTATSNGQLIKQDQSAHGIAPTATQHFLFHLCANKHYGEKYFFWVIKNLVFALREASDFRNQYAAMTSPLCAATSAGHDQVVELLLFPDRFGEEGGKFEGSTPLISKSVIVSKTSFGTGLAASASPPSPCYFQRKTGSLPFFTACTWGRTKIIKLFLEKLAVFEQEEERDQCGYETPDLSSPTSNILFPHESQFSPLIAAVKSKSLPTLKLIYEAMQVEITRLIKQEEADETNGVLHKIFSNLEKSSSNNKNVDEVNRSISEAVNYLKNKLFIHIAGFVSSGGDNILQLACQHSDFYSGIKYILEKSFEIDETCFSFKNKIPRLSEEMRISPWLLRRKEIVDRRENRKAAIVYAVQSQDVNLVKLLLEYSVKCAKKNLIDPTLPLPDEEDSLEGYASHLIDDCDSGQLKLHRTPLHYAIETENVEIIKLLLFEGRCDPAYHASFNGADSKGFNRLFKVVFNPLRYFAALCMGDTLFMKWGRSSATTVAVPDAYSCNPEIFKLLLQQTKRIYCDKESGKMLPVPFPKKEDCFDFSDNNSAPRDLNELLDTNNMIEFYQMVAEKVAERKERLKHNPSQEQAVRELEVVNMQVKNLAECIEMMKNDDEIKM